MVRPSFEPLRFDFIELIERVEKCRILSTGNLWKCRINDGWRRQIDSYQPIDRVNHICGERAKHHHHTSLWPVSTAQTNHFQSGNRIKFTYFVCFLKFDSFSTFIFFALYNNFFCVSIISVSLFIFIAMNFFSRSFAGRYVHETKQTNGPHIKIKLN